MEKHTKDQEKTIKQDYAAANDAQTADSKAAALHPPPLQLVANKAPQKKSAETSEENVHDSPSLNFDMNEDGNSGDPGKSVQRIRAGESRVERPFQFKKNAGSAGLPTDLKKGTEQLSGFSMDDVQVHHNSNKPAQLNAHAFAQGNDIHVASGQEKHLPHEAWHVVQQKQGRVKPTVQKKGSPGINEDASLEKEADVQGAKAASIGASSGEEQTGIGNSAPVQAKNNSEGPVQMKGIKNPSGALTAIRNMTVKDFKQKLSTDPDWANGLTKAEKAEVNSIDNLLDEDATAACNDMRLLLFHTVVNGDSVIKRNFRTYKKAVSNQWVIEGGENIKTPGLAEALSRGAAMWKLVAAFPDYILRNALTGGIFMSLYTGNFIDDLARYYLTTRPIFQSKKDFSAYYDFRTADNGNPLDYNTGPLKTNVRSLHKFHKTTLEKAQANYNDKSKSKPLTLYIHTGIDWNGAFVRDPANNAVLSNGHTLTLLVEGMKSLSAAKAKIGPLAKKYGQNNKIAQVMLAGHGDAQSMELTGEIKEGKDGSIEQTNNTKWGSKNQDLSVNSKKGKAFIDELIKHMESPEGEGAVDGPHARIMFNACLTNSHDAAEAVRNGDIANTKEAINKYIKEHPNLVEYTKKRAKELGNEKLETMGANASTYQGLGFMDPATGKLNYDTTNYTGDAASSVQGDKLDYIKDGREWTGLTRALVEELAKDKDAAIGAINTRLATAPANDKERFQQIGLKLIKAYAATNYKAATFIMDDMEKFAAGKIENYKMETKGSVSWLDGPDMKAYYGDPAMKKIFKGFDNIQKFNWLKPLIAYHQAWSVFDAKADKTVNYIGQQPCKYNSSIVNVGFLESKGLIDTMLDGGGSRNGKIVLAVLTLTSDPTHAKAKSYLKGLLDANDKFPAGLDMATKVADVTTVAALEALVNAP